MAHLPPAKGKKGSRHQRVSVSFALFSCKDVRAWVNERVPFFKVLLRRKFLFLFPSFFNINLLHMFKIIQIAKNWNDIIIRPEELVTGSI